GDDHGLGLLAEGTGGAVVVRAGRVEGARVLADVDVVERRVTGQVGHVDQEVGGVRLVTGGTGGDHQADGRARHLDRVAQVGQLRVRHAGGGHRNVSRLAVRALRV